MIIVERTAAAAADRGVSDGVGGGAVGFFCADATDELSCLPGVPWLTSTVAAPVSTDCDTDTDRSVERGDCSRGGGDGGRCVDDGVGGGTVGF